MSVQRTFYCDAPDCDTHGSSQSPGWLIVTDREGPRKHFCNGDCLFKWMGANSEPPTIIHMDGTVEDGGTDERPS